MSGGFVNRAAAGVGLGEALLLFVPERTAVVLALPRGGVVTGCEVARLLGVPLDVVIVRKLGTPGMPELTIGAIARGVRVLNDSVVQQAGIAPEQIAAVAQAETKEVERREALYRAGRRGTTLIGNAAVSTQLGWCAQERGARACSGTRHALRPLNERFHRSLSWERNARTNGRPSPTKRVLPITKRIRTTVQMPSATIVS